MSITAMEVGNRAKHVTLVKCATCDAMIRPTARRKFCKPCSEGHRREVQLAHQRARRAKARGAE